MMGNTFRMAVLQAAETALNQALQLDPASQRQLLELLELPLEIRLDNPAWSLALWRTGDRISLMEHCGEPARLAMSGSPLSFLALFSGDEFSLHDGRITLQGDDDMAQRLIQILNQLELDWEAALARVLGDIPAHFIGKRLRETLRWGQQARVRLQSNLDEYIREESGALPPRAEADYQFSQIDALHVAIDRLDARIQQLLETSAFGSKNPATDTTEPS